MIKFLKVLLIVSSFISCHSQTSEEYRYLKILKDFDIKDIEQWTINMKMPNDIDELLIEYKKETKDTLKQLQIIVEIQGETEKIIDEKMFVSIIKDTLMQRAKLIGNTDTSFIYTTTLDNKGDFVFIVGKYEYLYTSMELNWGQKLYYEKFRDSLKLVRGNDLPLLPELEYKEELQIFEAVD